MKTPRLILCLFPFLAMIPLLATTAIAQTGVQCDGTNDYVTFGQALPLGVSQFTLELWFRRDGAGVTTSTGTGGVTAIPLLTKGRGEADGSNLDMNFFFGIRGTDNVLCADFEEGAGQTSPGLNHPVAGVTPIRNGVWYHAAATYDGTTWRLFLNGQLETVLVIGPNRLPRSDSIQHAGLATALTSTGAAAGFFNGVVDEPRVWNRARTQQAITDSMLIEVASAPGLIGRWGLNEGTGTTATNSVGGSPNGTLTNGPVWATGSPFALSNGLAFGSANAYVTFGNAASLGLAQFTLETWFRRDGAGATTTTGTGGVIAIPLVTKGRGEAEGSNVDMNYFLGIRGSDNVLCADFEEGAGGSSPGLNHPIVGVTPIVNGAWYHAAVTYDGTKWQLFLNGNLENELTVGQPPRSDSIQHSALGTAMTSTGAAAGFFNGALDETRVWVFARTQSEIAATINTRIESPQSGLVARWGLDEGAGSAVHASAGTTVNGTITGTGWSWTGPAPFNISFEVPADPTDLAATAYSHAEVRLTWTDVATSELQYEVERSTTGLGGPFSLRATLGPNTNAWADHNLDPNADYCYRVRATNSVGASGYSNVACATTPTEGDAAVDFGPPTLNGYVTFGDPAALDLAQFTLETWFRRDGAGVTTSTGSGGFDAVPLVTKGRAESDGSNVDMNYFFGIHGASSVICADFEEGASGGTPGLNHPIVGVTPITNGVWYHGAVTYDGATWKLYLNGTLDAELAVGQPPRSDSIQRAALATALNSTGAAAGFFDGVLDEARIWNRALTIEEIRSNINAELSSPNTGLVARWGLNEGVGTTVHGSAGTLVNGTLAGTNWTWTTGAPFDIVVNDPPAAPALVSPLDGAIDVATSPQLCVNVSDPEADTLSVTFYGRTVIGQQAGPDFTLIGIPDTQNYTASAAGGSPAIFSAQTHWIVSNLASRNIAYVQHVGDVVESGDNGGNPIQWVAADSCLAVLEDTTATHLPYGVPFGISIGNHEQTPNGDAAGTTTFFNQYFGSSRFDGRPYYGGHFGANNDDNFVLFSASGLDFIVINMEYDTAPDAGVLAWADSLLTAHSSRRAIIGTHNLIGTGNPATFSSQGSAIYGALKQHENLFLMLSGHAPGEGRRSDTYNGNTVTTLMADYQSRTNGGDGWLRLMEFSPAGNVIRVKTYSPTLDRWEADADSSSQFTLAYDMTQTEAWTPIATATGVVSGSQVCIPWPGRSPLTRYEWYAAVSDGQNTTQGPVWSFMTVGQTTLTVDVSGDGSVTKEPDLPVYDLGTPVLLTAVPDSGWAFVEWSGDATGSDNPLTIVMDEPKTVTAHFRDATAPFGMVTSPNGGESLEEGVDAVLTWAAGDNVGVSSVDLLLSRAGAEGPFEAIAAGLENTGSHPWTVTGPATEQAFLKIVAHDAAGNTGEDLSDAAFTIILSTTGVEESAVTAYTLRAAAPNPFRAGGVFRFEMPEAARVRLSVLDIQGRRVAVLVDGVRSSGRHTIAWNGRSPRGRMSAGVYFLRFETPKKAFTERFVLAK